jgi:quercetin 2,3-dioxygenase
MFNIIRANERHIADHGWLTSYFLFSFADYYDPANIHFGPLRVFNDDRIAGNSGFPNHPHGNMEIVTIVLNGAVDHKDSMGNTTSIKAGEVQRMTAGTGITHSEANTGDKELHLYQLWFIPSTKDLPPSYEQKDLKFTDSKNELIPLVSGQKVLEDVIYINSNSTIYWCNLENEKELDMETFKLRNTFIYVNEGEINVNGSILRQHDQARITEEEKLHFIGRADSRFILIDLPSDGNY